jgi:hypothetical protein
VESPESNGMVRTFKRDYIRINPLPDTRTALARIDHWMEETRFRTSEATSAIGASGSAAS